MVALIAKQGPDLAPQIVVEDVYPAVIVEIFGVAAHGGDSLRIVVVSNAQRQALLLEGPIAFIDEKEVVLGVVGDKDVLPAIVVEIGDGDSHTFARRSAETGFLGDIFELAVPEVVIQPEGTLVETPRIAVIFIALGGAAEVGLRSPDCVVGDDQIEQAIVVVVEPCGGDAQGIGRLAANAGGAVTSVNVPSPLL